MSERFTRADDRARFGHIKSLIPKANKQLVQILLFGCQPPYRAENLRAQET
jgi:hypothetical protein